MDLTNKSKEELIQIAEAVDALREKYKYNQLALAYSDTGKYRRELYSKHIAFMNAGKDYRFRMFAGGNRTGKSFTGAVEATYHMLGEYPSWWKGKILRNPKTVWIIAESGALFRDSLQKLFLGNTSDEFGTGLIPKDRLGDTYSMPGISGATGRFLVKHKKGHFVDVIVKTYEMSREQFQAAKVDLVMFDEEPPEQIYTECLMRLMGAGKEPGISMLLFTPLKGYSNVVKQFLIDGTFPESGQVPEQPDRFVLNVTWNDAPHLSEEDKRAMIAQIPPHLRDSRTKGLPTMGLGLIFPVEEEFYIVKPFEIPEYWPKAYGLDFGWNNTACVWLTQDPSSKIYYIYSEYKRGQVIPALHAQAIKSKGEWIEGGCDPAGLQTKDDGTTLIDFYRRLGLKIHQGNNAREAGIAMLLNLLESGGFKVFSTCQKWIAECRTYRYDDKNPNKPADRQDDHLLDATRYGLSVFDHISISEHQIAEQQFGEPDISRNTHRDNLTGY